MAEEITKCPMCGTKLKMMNGRMTCKKCGYYIRNQNETDNFQNAGSYSASQAGGSTGQSYSQSGQTGTSRSSGSGNRNSGYAGSSGNAPEHNPRAAALTAVIGGIVCVALFAVIVVLRAGIVNPFSKKEDPSADSASPERPIEMDEASSQESESAVSASKDAVGRTPSSELFQMLAEYIWDKPLLTVSEEEYASLKAIQISREEHTIQYQLDSEDLQTVTYPEEAGMDLADLAYFTGLEWISVDDSLSAGDLDGLESLYGVYSENTIEEMLRIVPDPAYITDLGVEDSFLAKDLSGLESFPNLLYLSLDYYGLEDISLLKEFPDLVSLSITGCDRLTDFSPLMTLTNLEYLYIDSEQLRTIDFIKNMPALANLSIESGLITNIDALESCPGLTSLYLYLDDCYDISDYSVISRLPLLQQLELEMSWGGGNVLPSFADMPDLWYLAVKNASDLTPLKDAAGLTHLSLENCRGDSLETIASLQNLNVLAINDFSSYAESLEPLTRLPSLTELYLEETSVFGFVEEIFGIPTLNCLSLHDCQVGIDFDNMPSNEALEILSLSGVTILRDPTYNNGDTINLSDHYDIFDHFPNLTELYAASLKLDSIDFVEKLPRLQYLDITDNNVTSLKPLEALSDFQAVWCGRNTILENLPEDSDIWVYTTEP